MFYHDYFLELVYDFMEENYHKFGCSFFDDFISLLHSGDSELLKEVVAALRRQSPFLLSCDSELLPFQSQFSAMAPLLVKEAISNLWDAL